jgi:hypothetical protein
LYIRIFFLNKFLKTLGCCAEVWTKLLLLLGSTNYLNIEWNVDGMKVVLNLNNYLSSKCFGPPKNFPKVLYKFKKPILGVTLKVV